MLWLCVGVLWWAVVHLTPSVAPGFRSSMIERYGEKPWRALFAVDIVFALALMVFGWRSITPQILYLPPIWAPHAALLLMAVSVFLFGAAQGKSSIKRVVRHPMLSSVVVWSVAHLLANGDTRSLVLFGGLGAWAVIEMLLISRREGPWSKPDAAPPGSEIKALAITAVVYIVLVFLHPYFAGVSPIPG